MSLKLLFFFMLFGVAIPTLAKTDERQDMAKDAALAIQQRGWKCVESQATTSYVCILPKGPEYAVIFPVNASAQKPGERSASCKTFARLTTDDGEKTFKNAEVGANGSLICRHR